MEKTRTSVVLAGQEFKLTGTESEEYIKQLSDYVNGKINEIQRTYPNLSTGNCVLLASLNMADELHKLRVRIMMRLTKGSLSFGTCRALPRLYLLLSAPLKAGSLSAQNNQKKEFKRLGI